jgi:hypothetical protein
MPMNRRDMILSGAAVFVAPLVASDASAQVIAARGVGTVAVSGRAPSPSQRAAAITAAQINAVERHIAETNPARSAMFQSARASLAANIDEYLLNTTTLSEEVNRSARTFTIVVRADINGARLDSLLLAQAQPQQAPGGGSDIVIVYLSRAQTSVQTFADRTYSRTDTSSGGSNQSRYSRDASEGERVRQNSVSTSDRIEEAGSSSNTTSNTIESGGSVTRRADVAQYTVSPATDVNQTMTGIFAGAGLNVVEAEFVDGIDLPAVRSDFGEGDDLRPETLRGLVSAVRSAGVRYVSIGTLTTGMQDRDPVSGNVRVPVTVNARLYDLSRQFPRVVSSVGPIQFAGLGPDQSVAQTNAMQNAADAAARRLVDEMLTRGVQ